MPIEFDWDNDDQTVLRFVATDPWNWSDFHRTMRVATFRLDMVDHPVELIVDLRQSVTLPAGALGHIRSLGATIHPNLRGRLVMIGLAETVAGPLGGADDVYRAGGREIHFVNTDADAQAIIAAWLAE